MSNKCIILSYRRLCQISSNGGLICWYGRWTIEVKINVFFLNDKCIKLKGCDLNRFEDTWYLGSTQSFTIKLALIYKFPITFSVISVIKSKFVFVDLPWKLKFVDATCKNSQFSYIMKFLNLELWFWYHRKTVQLWWLTQRWKVQTLNIIKHLITTSYFDVSR